MRFADDFVCFCKTKEDAYRAIQKLEEWLAKRGLNLSKEKTRIVHLSEGFDFLGFNCRTYKVSTTKSGWKTLIKPSKEAVAKLRKKIRQVWLDHRGKPVLKVINELNPIIRGWANYFRTQVANKTFRSLDNWMFWREVRYVRRTHPNKSRKWRDPRYWGRMNLDRPGENWVFGNRQTGDFLLRFRWFSIERHNPVRGRNSPDDPGLREYWQNREKAKAKTLIASKQKLAKRQGLKCPKCGESLFNGEDLHLHHKKPRQQRGRDTYSNLEIVHFYCHQQIHATLRIEGSME